MGIAQCQVGAGEYRTTLLEAAAAAERLDATDRVVAAALANSRGFVSAVGGIDHERIGQLERALDALGDERSATRARSLPCWRRTSRPPARSSAGWIRAPRRWRSPGGSAIPTSWSRSASDAAIRLADQIGQPTLRWITTWTRVLRSWLDRDLLAAEARINEAFSLGFESEQPDAAVVPSVLLMYLRWAQGRTDEIEPVLKQMLVDDVQLPGLRAGLATMHCETGNFDGAREVVAGEFASGFASLTNDPYELNSVVRWCHAVADLRHRDAAEALLPRLLPYRNDVGAAAVVTSGTVATAVGQLLAVLGRSAEAVASFQAGLERSERLGAPFLAATTHYWWARCLLHAGEAAIGEPEAHIDAALTLAQT